MSNPIPEDYKHLLAEVKQRIRSAQYEALKAVNKELIAFTGILAKQSLPASREKAGVNL